MRVKRREAILEHVCWASLAAAGFALDVDNGLRTCSISHHRRLPRCVAASRDCSYLLEGELVRSPLQNRYIQASPPARCHCHHHLFAPFTSSRLFLLFFPLSLPLLLSLLSLPILSSLNPLLSV